jgi:hypothetical protein
VKSHNLLSSWGYQLETAETLTLLWPPAVLAEDVSLISTDTAYIYTTFELQPHGNINVHSEAISKITDGLTKVVVNPRIKVYKKNAELMIETHLHGPNVRTELETVHKSSAKFQASDDSSFLFNCAGVFHLSKGAVAQMTPNSKVNHYSKGYLDEVILPADPTAISEEQLLQNALIHYKRTEPLNWDDFESYDLSQTAFHYIENCEKTGLINSAAKLLIKEGRI